MIKPIRAAVTINTVLLSHTVTGPLFQEEFVSCVSKCSSVRRHITGDKTPWARSLAAAEELRGTRQEMALCLHLHPAKIPAQGTASARSWCSKQHKPQVDTATYFALSSQ